MTLEQIFGSENVCMSQRECAEMLGMTRDQLRGIEENLAKRFTFRITHIRPDLKKKLRSHYEESSCA